MSAIPTENFRSPAALARFVLTCAAGLAIDLATKVWAFRTLAISVERLPDGKVIVDSLTYEFIPGWLHFTCVANQGAVFGMGQGQRPLFIVVSIAAIAFLTYLFATSGRQRIYQVILGLLLSGVLGNMYDRVVYQYVRDMIFALPRWPKLFPWVFNVADTLLCVGVGAMIVYSFFAARTAAPEERDERQMNPDESC